MTNLLIRLFIKDYKNTDSQNVRARYGTLSGAVGIAVNVLLAAVKFIVGTLTNSISITADSVNNFSDAGSSIITLVGFKMSNKPADKDHPFGHGRIEYISGLIVSFIILIFGLELLKSSVTRIFKPEPVTFSIAAIVVLSVSILGKIWLACFNHKIGNTIQSATMSAVVTDSISDCGATFVTILSLILAKFTSFNADAYFGVIVAVIILIAGIKLVKETIDPLLGQPVTKEFVDAIEKEALSYDGVVAIHDLLIHNYGTNNIIGSMHAEIPADIDVMKAHDTIDTIEKEIKQKFNIDMTIHYDPIITDDECINKNKIMTQEIIKQIDESITIHDFRMVVGYTHTNFIFDIVVPFDCKYSEEDLLSMISERFYKINKSYFTVVTIDRNFTN